MKKVTLIIFIFLLIAGCGGSSKDNNPSSNGKPLIWESGNWDEQQWQ